VTLTFDTRFSFASLPFLSLCVLIQLGTGTSSGHTQEHCSTDGRVHAKIPKGDEGGTAY